LKLEKRSRDEFELKQRLVERAGEVYTLLAEDETPEIDHLFDEAWLFAEEKEDVSLRDISSKFNPNWLQEQMLEHLRDDKDLSNSYDITLLADAKQFPYEDFRDFRYKYGPLADIRHAYGRFFTEEAFEILFTEYNYFNFSITSEFMHERLFALRMDNDTEGEKFRDEFSKYLTSLIPTGKGQKIGKPMRTREDLDDWYSLKGFGQSAYDLMFPLVNAEPAMNLHHAPEEVIYAVLKARYNGFQFSRAQFNASKIVEARAVAENGLTRNQINNIINFHEGYSAYPKTRFFQFFGFTTWFWEITVTEDESRLQWIIARIPPKKATDDPAYKLVKEQFTIVHEKTVPDEEKEAASEDGEAAAGGEGQTAVEEDGGMTGEDDYDPFDENGLREEDEYPMEYED
jgi:hypothetical protein